MNILDITQADIERLKAMEGTDDFTTRDKEIRDVIGRENFQYISVCRLRPDYTLPAPTEADIIKYLQASEVPPSQWPPVVQEWARRHDENGVWECKLTTGVWAKTVFIISPVSGAWYSGPHRLRADYGRKEPEVCVWKSKGIVETSCRHCYTLGIEIFHPIYCPNCGKRIEIKL